MNKPAASIDHLVVCAANLDAGVAWCEATLGVTPGPGGKHALFATHNRLLKLALPDQGVAYLEIIAPDPDAAPVARRRWFDMDDDVLQASIERNGPRLVHWVAAVPEVEKLAHWRTLDLERGEVLQASRPAPQGLLEWQISVRPDGQRLMEGCLPTLITWGSTHPTQHMPDSGLVLTALTLRHPQAPLLNQALDVAGLEPSVQAGPACLEAVLQTPRGVVRLASDAS